MELALLYGGVVFYDVPTEILLRRFLQEYGLLLIIGAALYFLPTIIVATRGAHNGCGVFLTNFFLGWTLIGWIVALIWALSSSKRG